MLSFEVADKIAIGIMSVEILRIIGLEQPSGNACFTISILSRISFTAPSISIPQLNSQPIIAVFSFEVEVSSFRSLTVLRALSIIFVTLFSTSSALAPGYDTITYA